MSLQDARYALAELSAGRAPDRKRALEGLQAMIGSRLLSDPNLALASDLLQRFVVTGDDIQPLREVLFRADVMAAIRRMPDS